MKAPASRLLIAVPVLLAAMTAYAGGNGSNNFSARFRGYSEVPAVSSTGQGTFRARLNEGTTPSLDYTLTYSQLEGTTTLAAHIHLGQPDVNGGVSAFLCGGAGKPPCPPTEGVVEGTITPADVIGPTGQGIAPGEFVELIKAMRSGVTYANIHTNKHPGGEIRGNIRTGSGHGHGNDDD